jgi:predicted esterase
MIVEKATPQQINLRYDLYIPDREKTNEPMPLIIGLHGYEGSKESMMARLQAINPRDFAIASIQGPNSFLIRDSGKRENTRVGFGWMMQYKADETVRLHHKTVAAVIEETAADQPIDRKAIFLIGFSQTVSLNYRFAFTYPRVIRGVVAICGGIPGDWERDIYQNSDTDILIIAGEQDEFYTPERTRTFQAAMERRAASVEYHGFPVGHVFPREADRLIGSWLLERLRRSGLV